MENSQSTPETIPADAREAPLSASSDSFGDQDTDNCKSERVGTAESSSPSVADEQTDIVDTDTVNSDKNKDLTSLKTNETEYSDGVFPLGKIPVEISVELGHFFVDASKQNSLDDGDVITLTSSTPGQVRLICNDHEVGRGELVDINGQLGVQIIRSWSA